MNEYAIDIVNEYFKTLNAIVGKIDRLEEASLWEKTKKGNKAARERLFHMYLCLVVPIAKRFCRGATEIMDLIEEGNLGLLHAIDKFDPSRGYRFSTYAIHWIGQYVRHAAEEQTGPIRVPSHAWSNLRAWAKTWDNLKEKLGREPSLKEMSRKLNLSARKISSVLDALNAVYGVESLSALIGGGEEKMTLEDIITDGGKENPDNSQAAFAVDEDEDLESILAKLPSRDRKILMMRFGIKKDKEMTLEEIGRKLGLTRERIRQIERRALKKAQKYVRTLSVSEKIKKACAAYNKRKL